MIYLEFNTEQEANNANTQISENMGLGGVGDVTKNWADIITLDSKFLLIKPEERFLDGVLGYLEVEAL